MTAILPLAEAYRRLVVRVFETTGRQDSNPVGWTVDETDDATVIFTQRHLGTPATLIGAALKSGVLEARERSGNIIGASDFNRTTIDLELTVIAGKVVALDYRVDDIAGREIFFNLDAFEEWQDRQFVHDSHTAEEWLRALKAKGGPNPYGTVENVVAEMKQAFKISEREAIRIWGAVIPKHDPWRLGGRRRKSSH